MAQLVDRIAAQPLPVCRPGPGPDSNVAAIPEQNGPCVNTPPGRTTNPQRLTRYEPGMSSRGLPPRNRGPDRRTAAKEPDDKQVGRPHTVPRCRPTVDYSGGSPVGDRARGWRSQHRRNWINMQPCAGPGAPSRFVLRERRTGQWWMGNRSSTHGYRSAVRSPSPTRRFGLSVPPRLNSSRRPIRPKGRRPNTLVGTTIPMGRAANDGGAARVGQHVDLHHNHRHQVRRPHPSCGHSRL